MDWEPNLLGTLLCESGVLLGIQILCHSDAPLQAVVLLRIHTHFAHVGENQSILVRCRFQNPNLKELEARDDELTTVSYQESASYNASLEGNRNRAFLAVSSYITSRELRDASLQLYQVFPYPPQA